MHVYLREEAVRLELRHTDPDGLVPEDSGLVAISFHVTGSDQASFRSMLPAETVSVLEAAMAEPVQLGLLAEEPDSPEDEVQAMVGLALPVDPDGTPGTGQHEPAEPWKASAADSEAWRGATDDEQPGDDAPRTALLTFAPLVRIQRKFPLDFGEELADLLETALSGQTRPVLEARVDRMLGEL